MEYGIVWKPATRPQQKRRGTQTPAQTAVNDCVWRSGDWKNGCSERNFVVGILNQITLVISYAGIRKRNAGLPSLVTAACSLFSSTVKRDHKMKRQLWHIPSSTGSSTGALPSLPLLFCFFFPQCVERELLLCANAAMKPGLTNVLLSVAPGITSPQMFYLIIHGANFAVLLSGIDQDPSFTLWELYPLCTHTKKEKRFSPNTRFHQVNKAPARFAFFKISGLTFFVLFNRVF